MNPQIYVLKNTYGLSEAEKAFLLSYVDAAKKERIEKCRFSDKADGILLGDVLCRTAIWKAFGIPTKEQRFIYTDSGKPLLEGFQNVHFSRSHSGSMVACAVSQHPIGIDIEKIGNFPEKVAERVCSYAELTAIMESEDKASAFTKLWTKKEAAIKLRGQGLFRENLKTCLEAVYVESTQIGDYWLSVATYDAK